MNQTEVLVQAPDQSVAGRCLIRVYGDSLSLPRAPGGIGHWQTYTEMLVENLKRHFSGLSLSLYNRSGGGLTISALYERYLGDCSYFGASAHEVLVIQCGIVDCAPRPIPGFVRSLLAKMHGRLRAPIIRLLHCARPTLLKAGLSWRLTTPSRFSIVLSQWLAHATSRSARVYVINIAPTVPAIAAHSPGLAASIVAYNALIAAAVAAAPAGSAVLVDVHSAISQKGDVAAWVSPADGHHITRQGNLLYSELILQHELQRLGTGAGSQRD